MTDAPSDGRAPSILGPGHPEDPWVRDFERVKSESKFVRGAGPISEVIDVPLSLALTVIGEAASRPEIVAAYAAPQPDGRMPERESHVLGWCQEYLRHKHGNRPDPTWPMNRIMFGIADGRYSGPDDPRVRADLLTDPFACHDDLAPGA